MRRLFIGLIRGYQALVSSWLPPRCRFLPSCSQYGIEALREYGVWRGGILLAKRLLRCHPGCDPGYDPVPLRPPPMTNGPLPARSPVHGEEDPGPASPRGT